MGYIMLRSRINITAYYQCGHLFESHIDTHTFCTSSLSNSILLSYPTIVLHDSRV